MPQIRAEQIKNETLSNLQIAINAAISQSKIANQSTDPTGWITKGVIQTVTTNPDWNGDQAGQIFFNTNTNELMFGTSSDPFYQAIGAGSTGWDGSLTVLMGNEGDDWSGTTARRFTSTDTFANDGSNLFVYMNGLLLELGSEYSIVDSDTIELDSSLAATAQDKITLLVHKNASLNNYATKEWVTINNSISLNGAYDNGSLITVDDTNVDFRLSNTKEVKISNSEIDLVRFVYDKSKSTAITYGSKYIWHNNNTASSAVVGLDDTHFAIAYIDADDGSKPKAIIGTVSNNTEIAYGSDYLIYNGSSSNIEVCKVSTTQFIIIYAQSSTLYAVIATVSNGTEIAFGTPTSIDSGAITPSVKMYDSSHFVVAYTLSSVGRARVGTITGTSIAFQSSVQFDVASCNYPSVATLDTTHVAISYNNSVSGTSKVYSIIGTITNGTTLTFGTRVAALESGYDIASGRGVTNAFIDSTHFVVAYSKYQNPEYNGFAIVASVANGNEITYGSEACFEETYQISSIYATNLDNNRFLISYCNITSTANYGTSIIGYVYDSNKILFGPEFNYSTTGQTEQYISNSAIKLSPDYFVVSFCENNNAPRYGTAVVGYISPAGEIYLKSTLLPAENGFVNIGSSAKKFNSVYTKDLFVDGNTLHIGSTAALKSTGNSLLFTQDGVNYLNFLYSGYPNSNISIINGQSGYGVLMTGKSEITCGGGSLIFTSNFYNNREELPIVANTNDTFTINTNIFKLNSNSTNILTANLKPSLPNFEIGSTYTGISGVAYPPNGYCKIDENNFYFVTRISSKPNLVKATYANNTITYGTPIEILATDSANCGLVFLDTTHLLISYTNVSNSYGRVIIGTIDGEGQITFGNYYEYNNAITYYPIPVKLDATHFAISFIDGGDGNKGKSIVGTISNGNEISYGSKYIFDSLSISLPYVRQIDSSSFIIIYSYSTYGYGIVATVSNGNEISFGTKTNFTTSGIGSVDLLYLESNKYYLSYRNSNSYYGSTVTVSGSNLTFNALSQANISMTSCSAQVIDSTHILLLYSITSGSTSGNRFWATINTISGDTVTIGTKSWTTIYDNTWSTNVHSLSLSASLFVLLDPGVNYVIPVKFFPVETTINTSLIPGTTETYDLGSADKKFKDIYAQSGHFDAQTLYLGDTVALKVDEGKLKFSNDGETFAEVAPSAVPGATTELASTTGQTVDISSDTGINLNGDVFITNLNFSPLAEGDDFAKIYVDNSGNNTLIKHQIGADAGDKISFESNNGSSITSLLEITGDGNVLIPGNLTVNGTTIYLDSTNTQISDSDFVIKYAATGVDGNASISVRRAKTSVEGDRDAQLKWNETSDLWEAGIVGNIAPIAVMRTAGDGSIGAVKYNATTATDGQFYGGTTDPTNTTRLNYDGYFYATRVYNAIFNDLAEFMDKDPAFNAEPGMILIQTEYGLKPSYHRADKRCVGIYSDTYGYALGANDQENKYPVALSGRADVWIAEPCKIGDLLISSNKPGFATVATEEEEKIKGIIIGKVLTNKINTMPERIKMLILNA